MLAIEAMRSQGNRRPRGHTLGLALLVSPIAACQIVIGIEQRTSEDRDRAPTVIEAERDASAEAGTDDAGEVDAGGEVDASVDAGVDAGDASVDANPGPACNRDEPFGTPSLVVGPASPAGEFGATLSVDERELFFTTTAIDRAFVHRATRETRDGPFGAATVVDELRSIPSPHWSLSLSADGLTLYVTAGAPPRDIYRATRPTTSLPFEEAERVVFSGWDAAAPEEHVFAGVRGALFLTIAIGTTFDLYAALPRDGGLRAPTPLLSQSSPAASESWPVESFDGLSLYYAVGGPVASDIYEARRDRLDQSFPVGAPLPFVTTNRKHPVWISPDGCRLYLVQDNAPGGVGDADLWVAARPR